MVYCNFGAFGTVYYNFGTFGAFLKSILVLSALFKVPIINFGAEDAFYYQMRFVNCTVDRVCISISTTHCLWKWHERPATFSRGCWRQRPWTRHRHLFGETVEQQETRKTQEGRAWYDVIKSSDILHHTNVTSDWDRPDSFLQSVMWC